MNLTRERRLFALLGEIGELDPAARAKALAACDDPSLAQDARQMLTAVGSIGGFLEAPVPMSAARALATGDTLGPYTIEGVLGEGGMGTVFRARQREPVKRYVALKILHLNRLSAEAKVRFEAERQAMARLEHPNVGRILEAGTTEDGLPFFAMELIDGPPITTYCDRGELSIERRLRLFQGVCRGTHHAHLKMLLHRDLKPSNILISEVDGRPIAKIIDFGIAKGLDAPLAPAAAPTGDRFVGTPAYMSPEALEPGSELDTRSDVFSLGVLLYELLTGLDPWATSHADPVEIIRRRQNYDAERPSTQITDLDGEQREHIARRRQLDAGRLVHRLRGDLDSIVMKAIDSDPALRYESAAELADDIARHLADEPIRARPFTARVLVGKLVRRHRTAVIAASAVVLTLAIGVIGTVGGLLRARAAEQTARAEAAAAIAARDDADDAVHFLARIFDSANPLSHKARKRPEQVTALEILARGAERLDSDFEDSPLVKARLQEEIGRIYRRLGIFDEARKHLKASLANLESHGDPNSRDLADVQIQLAELEIRLANRETATFLLERALAILSAREESAREESAREEREDLRKRAEALDMLARVRRSGGDYGGAVEAQEQSMAIFRRLGGAVPALSAGHQNLGLTFSALGRWSAAEAEFRRAIELRKSVLKPGHPTFASHYNGLAMVIANQGRFEEAVEILVPLEAQLRSRLGDRHPKLANVLDNLGVQSVHLGRLEQAEAYLLEALEIRERTLGSEHPDTARSLDNLARVLEDLGRPGEARPMQERALAIREAALGAEHPDVARSLGHLARLAIGSRDFELAHRHAERAHRIRVTKLNSGHRDIGLSALDLGETLWHLERREEARRLFDEARALFAGGDESMRRDAEDAAARLAALGAR